MVCIYDVNILPYRIDEVEGMCKHEFNHTSYIIFKSKLELFFHDFYFEKHSIYSANLLQSSSSRASSN